MRIVLAENRQTDFIAILMLLISGCFVPLCPADEAEPTADKDEKREIPFTILKISVVDLDGAPIAGASVTGVGLRTKAERGSHYGWGEKTHGTPSGGMTDEEGITELRCPQFVYEQLEVGEVTLLVEHPDYVTFREDRVVGDEVAKVSLQYGRLMVVSAIDAESKQPVTTHLHGVLSGYGSAKEWEPLSGGKLISRTIDRKRSRLRMVHVPPDGPVKFSDIIDLSEYGDKRRVLLKDVELHAGVRVEGKLDENVPRPVKNGTVIAYVTVGIEADGWDYSGQNHWSDWTTIKEDGTFVFESLPRNAVAGLIAVSDGWICTAPDPADFIRLGIADRVTRGGNRVKPQLAKLEGNRIEPVIEMESTATCRVKVTTKEGEPIAGADVGMSPNQLTLTGGSTIVGSGYSMRVMLGMSEEERSMGWTEERRKLMVASGATTDRTRYYKQTNADGIVEFHTLPGGTKEMPRTESLSARHELYEQPSSDENRLRRQTSVQLVRDEVTEVTIVMDRKGTKVIAD